MPEYIERNAAIDALRRRLGPNTSPAQKNMLQLSAIDIRGIKAADVAPMRHGEWEWFEEWIPSTTEHPRECEDCGWRCGNCKQTLEDMVGGYWDNIDETPKLAYCPNCGAKMDGGMTDYIRHECSECDIKTAFRHLGPFGLLFIGYKGDPRGPIGRAGNMTLPEEALVMGTLVDVDGNRWVPVNEEVLHDLITEYKNLKEGEANA